MLPSTTRLRYVQASNPDDLTTFCDLLGKRIEIKSVQSVGGSWFLWFIPADNGSDIQSGKIKIVTVKGRAAIGYVKPKT